MSKISNTAKSGKLSSSGPQPGTGHGGLPHSSGQTQYSKGKAGGIKKGGGKSKPR